VILDFVDDHSMYQGQWRKRLAYYKRCSYQIEYWAMGGTTPSRVIKPAAQTTSVAVESSEGGAEGGCLILDD
jgi:hypothetical protein